MIKLIFWNVGTKEKIFFIFKG